MRRIAWVSGRRDLFHRHGERHTHRSLHYSTARLAAAILRRRQPGDLLYADRTYGEFARRRAAKYCRRKGGRPQRVPAVWRTLGHAGIGIPGLELVSGIGLDLCRAFVLT